MDANLFGNVGRPYLTVPLIRSPSGVTDEFLNYQATRSGAGGQGWGDLGLGIWDWGLGIGGNSLLIFRLIISVYLTRACPGTLAKPRGAVNTLCLTSVNTVVK